MKVAYHFLCSQKSSYIFNTLKAILRHITSSNINIYSKIYTGDVLFHSWGNEYYPQIIDYCSDAIGEGWSYFVRDFIQAVRGKNVYTIVFESIDKSTAILLNEFFLNDSDYIGSFEVNQTDKIHWELYDHCLCLMYRIDGKKFTLFCDDINEKSLVHNPDDWENVGFKTIAFEERLLKRSILDSDFTFEHTKDLAAWRKEVSDLLISISDNIIYKIDDAAPDIGKRLLVALRSFSNATNAEQYAQMALTCRRLLEYLADVVFPAKTENGQTGHKLSKDKYKNRLLEFVTREQASETSSALIGANIDALASQLDKLSSLQNKGLHAEFVQHEARRCLLRTFILIDDVLSVRETPLPPTMNIDKTFFETRLKKIYSNKDGSKTGSSH